MKLLLLLLSALMSWIIDTKSTIHGEGTWPNDIEASYSCTYKKGDVREGDTATLVLAHLDGITIDSVQVYLKSNKSAGAGIITVTADGEEIYRLEGDYKNWFGAYNNSEFQPIGWTGERTVNQLVVQVVGTANSLHIEKFNIGWTQQTAESHAVTLMKGNEQMQSLSGVSVTLPAMDDEGNWHFIGWTDMPFYNHEGVLESLIPAGVYQPARDITLWAVYEYRMSQEDLMVTDLQDGVYSYAETVNNLAMTGGAWNGVVDAQQAELTNTQQAYEVLFDEQGLATIRLLYVYGEEYIGFSGKQLVNSASKWQVYHNRTQTAFYTMVGEQTYVLFPGIWSERETRYVTELREVTNLEQTPTVLYNLESAGQITLTCYPEIGFDTEQVSAPTQEYILRIGQYKLRIRDGKKTLELW